MKIKRDAPQGPTGPKAELPTPKPTAPASPKAKAKAWSPTGTSSLRLAVAAAADAGKPAAATAVNAFQDPAFNKRLDSDTHSRSLDGNAVKMLFDGTQSFAERNKLIDGAKESICMQTFIFNSDDTGWELANKLAAKAKQGLDVRLIYDAMGSGRADPKMFQMMKDAGVKVMPYGEKWKVWDLNDRWHEKHLIIDGKTSIEGGMNIANEYAFGGSGRQVLSRGKTATEAWRDADVRVDGPAVGDATKAFLRNWQELGGTTTDAQRSKLLPRLEPQQGGVPVRVVQSNPEVKGLEQKTDTLYLRAIENAKKQITIENAYFLPPPPIRKALIEAAKRGVDVRVLTNSRQSNDMGFVSDAARYFYDEMMNAGVRIYEKQGGTLHAKTASFDGSYAIVGSVNLNGRSANQDSEVAMGVADESTARQLDGRFDSGMSQARPVTKAELAHESALTNLKQWAYSTLAWTF